MIYINVKENENLDKALKKYKKKYEKIGIIRELRSRQAFEKPSITRRMEIKKAAYREFVQNQEAK
ncbi:MAG: 30S ribosomal protein S21 [Bacteroidota bacterium]|jgi:small subunit ribosomal protein S21|nr:30S ribosomal protein S21 [Bacteroidota bacterium]